jgi:hypothetical protein
MNSFFYFDAVKDHPIFYHIITEFSREELIIFLKKKADDFCQKNDMDPEDFLNGNYDNNYFVEIKYLNKIYYFSLFSLLTDEINYRLKNEFSPEILKLNIEDTI